MIWLRADFASALPQNNDSFEYIMALDGETFKRKKGHRTLRIELSDKSYFLKAHTGVGWSDILKDLLRFRRPHLGARDEWRAIKRIETLSIKTLMLAGYGQRGLNPARLRSFVVTDEVLNTVSLETYCADWPKRQFTPTEIRFKRALIRRVAEIARVLHENGVNHRDFYLCHFLLDCSLPAPEMVAQAPLLTLIDLHRVQLRRATPTRWIVKDIGGLYFSAMDIGLTRTDLMRFIRVYRGSLRETLRADGDFWRAVRRRAEKMYRDFHSHAPHS